MQVAVSNLSVSPDQFSLIYIPEDLINLTCYLNGFCYDILNVLVMGVGVASFYYKSTFGEAGVSVLVSTAYTFVLKFVEFRGKTQFWSKLY